MHLQDYTIYSDSKIEDVPGFRQKDLNALDDLSGLDLHEVASYKPA